MAKDPVKALRAAIQLSKKITLNYGYCMGIDPWEAVWLTHRKRNPASLAKMAKKDGNTPKTAYGEMTTELNVITLVCEKAPPGRMAYNAKFYLKEFGLKYKIRIVGPDGTVLDESDSNMTPDGDAEEDDASAEDLAEADEEEDADDELEEDDEEEQAAEAARDLAPDPDLAKWQAMAAKLTPKVAETGSHPRAENIATLWKALNAKADSGDPAAALGGVPTLLKLMSAPEAQAAPEPDPAPAAPPPPKLDPALVARFKTAGAGVKERIVAHPPVKAELLALLQPARQALEAKDGDALAAALDPLEAALAQPIPQAASAQEPDPATAPEAEAEAVSLPDLPALADDLRKIWSKARSTTDSQLSQLFSTISGDGTEDGEDVVGVGLTAWAAAANAHMDEALKALAAAPPKRVKAAKLATTEAIATYAAFLESHPAVEAIEDNAQKVPVTLSATLGGALQEMSARVQAA